MNNPEEIKQILTPTQVVQHYLGSPVHSTNLGLWYRSPFRNERTASFLVYREKGRDIHDFGSSRTYDIISFVEEYFKVDFTTATKILSRDFGLPEDRKINKELKEYLKKRQEEQKQAEYIIKTWFNQKFNEICKELHTIQSVIPYLKGEALAIAYDKESKLEYLSEVFIDATDKEKIELYKEWRTKENGYK